MRKLLTVVLSAALVLGAFAADAGAAHKKRKPRKVTRTATSEYEAPALGAGQGVCLRPTNSCGDIPTGAKEKYAKVVIKDATGLPVYFTLGQDMDPNTLGTEHNIGAFCGTTGKKPLKILAGYPLVVFPWALGPTCAAIATRGTITATLSNLP